MGNHQPKETKRERRAAILAEIGAERARQVDMLDWTPDHDDQYTDGQLSRAAACYATASLPNHENHPPHDWPWDRKYWRGANERRNKIKAAALLMADIERMDRAAAKEGDNEA